jgi:O-methyltransferase/methyltransferase family protein
MHDPDRMPPVALPQQAAMLRMLSGFWLSRALSVVITLGIADLLKSGPKSIDELAGATKTHAPSLYRVLRALAAEGVFSEDGHGNFRATPLAAALQSGVPGSLRAFVLEQLDDEHYEAWGDLLHSVRTGETAFDHHFNMDLWQYRALHHEDATTFDEAMANLTAVAIEPILDAYDFSSFRTVVDIGGGDASLLTAILGKHPGVKGVLFDMPRVTPKALRRIEAAGLTHRCDIVSGDFFKSVTAGGNAYILKAVIHDWDDDKAAAILKNCLHAMAQSGRILLIEAVIPPGNGPFFHKFMDLNMMVMTGGRERTESEYRALLKMAGLDLARIVPTSSELNVIEAALG